MKKGIAKTLAEAEAAAAKNRERTGVLREARHTIVQLRRQNEILAAKAEVIDTFTAIARGLERRGGGFSPDVVCALDEMIKEAEAPAK